MRTDSPLRYPGGKSAMAGLLRQIRTLNGLRDRVVAEPFAGGAGASLALLYLEETPEIYINDADPAIYHLWWSLVHRSRQFLEMLTRTPVTMREWRRQRDTYRASRGVSGIRRGFAAFYLNRCNRSGIIMNGGPIGGVKQKGTWKLDVRFNKAELLRRCQKVTEYRERIHVSCQDGLELLRRLNARTTFFFIDPPYFVKGRTLYLNALDRDYHEALSTQLKSMHDAPWVLTYDDCAQIRRMYRDWATIRPFGLRYSAADWGSGKEVLITPRWMRLPTYQESAAIRW